MAVHQDVLWFNIFQHVNKEPRFRESWAGFGFLRVQLHPIIVKTITPPYNFSPYTRTHSQADSALWYAFPSGCVGVLGTMPASKTLVSAKCNYLERASLAFVVARIRLFASFGNVCECMHLHVCTCSCVCTQRSTCFSGREWKSFSTTAWDKSLLSHFFWFNLFFFQLEAAELRGKQCCKKKKPAASNRPNLETKYRSARPDMLKIASVKTR